MLLYDSHIQRTFLREGIDFFGKREVVLLVEMDEEPSSIEQKDPKQYQELTRKLGYLDTLAKHGFLDFDRIEISNGNTQH